MQPWQLARRDPVGPLAGVPIGIKDVIDVAGLLTTASSEVRAESIATEDAACVSGLRAAGATILGKLHTAEFACADPPPTRNPWNHAHTPGGSSSGSGVAVAAGMVPAALGTQTGGSTLRPAVYNGVVGLKPSYGLISNRGVIPVSWSFDHVGVIARSVADGADVHEVQVPSSFERIAATVPPIFRGEMYAVVVCRSPGDLTTVRPRPGWGPSARDPVDRVPLGRRRTATGGGMV